MEYIIYTMQEKEHYPPSKRDWENYENYDNYLKSITNEIQSMNCVFCRKPVGSRSLWLDRHRKCDRCAHIKKEHNPEKCCICDADVDLMSPFCNRHDLNGVATFQLVKCRNLYVAVNTWLTKTIIRPHAYGYVMPDGTFNEMVGRNHHGYAAYEILHSLDTYVGEYAYLDMIELFLKITGAVRIGYIKTNGIKNTMFEYYELNDTQKNIIYDVHAGLKSSECATLDGHGHPSEKLLNRKMSNITNHA